MTHDNDCNVYAIDSVGEFVLVDSGCGVQTGRLIANLKTDGIPLDSVAMLVLTHGHLDHSGGARQLRDRLHLKVAASVPTAVLSKPETMNNAPAVETSMPIRYAAT